MPQTQAIQTKTLKIKRPWALSLHYAFSLDPKWKTKMGPPESRTIQTVRLIHNDMNCQCPTGRERACTLPSSMPAKCWSDGPVLGGTSHGGGGETFTIQRLTFEPCAWACVLIQAQLNRPEAGSRRH